MALARVVSFEGVTRERIGELQREMSGGQPPEGLSPTEVLVLHDPDNELALAVVIFDTEEDYRRGDQVLGAMPAGDTPGRRASVTRYEVAVHRTM